MKKIYADEGTILITEDNGSNILSLVNGVEIEVSNEEFEKIKKEPQKYKNTYDKIVKEEKAKREKQKIKTVS